MKALTLKTIWVIVIGALTLTTLLLGVLSSFGITPVEAKQGIEVAITVAAKVAVTVEEVTATLDTEQIENLNRTLTELSDPELIALFKLWLEQEISEQTR